MLEARDPTTFLPLTDLAFNILVALTDRELHGYGLLQELRLQRGRGALRTGTVYAALARLQEDGLVEEVAGPAAEVDERRRYYTVTSLGRDVAKAEAGRLREVLGLAARRRLLPDAP